MAPARWSPAVLLVLGLVALVAVPSQAGAPSEASARTIQGVKAKVKRGTLLVTGNRRANSVTLRLRRRARGKLEVDVRSNGSADFTFKRSSFKRIVVRGAGGNDTLRVNERNGSFTRAERTTFDGGAGNDGLSGGRARETLRGGRGNDTITANGSDRVAGGSGIDLVRFSGSRGDDVMGVAASGALVRLTRNVGNVGVDASGVERLALTPLAGSDTVNLGNLTGTPLTDASLNLAPTASGTAGDGAADTLAVAGTDNGEGFKFSRAPGTLTLAGLPWAISASGVDASGDGLVVNGLGGADALQLTGADAGETFDLTANGGRLHASVAGGSVESDDVESVEVSPLGGADVVSVGNLAGTDISHATVDLGLARVGPPDGQVDTVELSATGGADNVGFVGGPNGVEVTGLAAHTFAINVDASDRVSVNGLAGADALDASALGANVVALTLRGGPDADTLTGTPGDDTFRWDPGDGSDVVAGGAGSDRMNMNGDGAAEAFQVSAVGARTLISRDVDSGSVDTGAVETAGITPAGGVDNVSVGNLAGADLTQVDVDLAGGDGQSDGVSVEATSLADSVNVVSGASGATVNGLAAKTTVSGAEPANDRLTVNALGDADTINSTGLAANLIGLTVNGGAGVDLAVGGPAAEVVSGGQANDVAVHGAGDDTFVWNPGDGSDTIEGQAGSDELVFNGSNASENIDLSANGGRFRFFRDVAAITMDTDDVERVKYNALGGSDNVVVNDLTGTDVSQATVELASAGGAGDALVDTVTVNARNTDDVIVAGGNGSSASITGLPAAVSIANAEGAIDRLTLNALGGTDVVDSGGLAANVIGTTVNGGLGVDTFIGGPGVELVNGGDGNDLAILGGGNDTFTWNPGDDNDTIEGQAGTDALNFNGANVAENVSATANGGRLRFFRDIASVTMDANDLEVLNFSAVGGADNITATGLAATDLTQFNVALAAAGGGGDAQADTVTLGGTAGDDVALLTGSGTSLTATGLVPTIAVTGAESANDRFVLNLGDGDDTVDASGVATGSMLLTLNGELNDDILIGGSGDDIITGGDGDDVLIGGPGTDALDGGPGSNVVIQ
jgi:Ca2+-binding RTX toxin-like protein